MAIAPVPFFIDFPVVFCNDLSCIRQLLRGLKFSFGVNDLCTPLSASA
jgi:hypothetical protein